MVYPPYAPFTYLPPTRPYALLPLTAFAGTSPQGAGTRRQREHSERKRAGIRAGGSVWGKVSQAPTLFPSLRSDQTDRILDRYGIIG